MIWRAILLALGLAAPLHAETVTVQSGEHAGFARIVLDLAAPAAWRMTRKADGYVLGIDRADLRFDVTDVHRRIARDRLAAIWTDPVTGALHLGVGCACHAIGFELRPGVLVVDLRDGPAPAGSAFERAADGSLLPALRTRAPQRPQPRPARLTRPEAQGSAPPGVATAGQMTTAASGNATYHWLALADVPRHATPNAGAPPEATGPARVAGGTAGLRDVLLTEISRAVARGTVDPAPAMPAAGQAGATASAGAPGPDPDHPAGLGDAIAAGLEGGHIRIDGLPGQMDRPAGPDANLTPDGATCLPDAVVDLAAWGDPRPVAQAMADRTAALYGEFDTVDMDAATQAAHYYLHLGFGAEVLRLIGTLDLASPDRPAWEAMARILDGETVVPGPFDGMSGCDGAVAMWAVLAKPGLDPGERPATQAILRNFSALPPHLRRHLGPMLADRYLARGETGPVRAIRDAIHRPGGAEDPAVALMAAQLEMANGAAPDLAALAALQAAPGRTGVAATIAAIDAAQAAPGPVDAGLVIAAEALLREHRGTEDEPALRAALARGWALQDRFDAAFEMIDTSGGDPRPIWTILAARGPDSAILAHAVRDPAHPLPDMEPDDRRRLARRLIDLGLGAPARHWLDAASPGTAVGDAPDRLLAAEAHLTGRDARAALRLLAGLDGDAASALRSAARVMLNAPAAPDMPEAEQARLARLQGDWTQVAREATTPWGKAAGLAAPPQGPARDGVPVAAPTSAPGPLAGADRLIGESVAARATLDALLTAVPPPVADGS